METIISPLSRICFLFEFATQNFFDYFLFYLINFNKIVYIFYIYIVNVIKLFLYSQ